MPNHQFKCLKCGHEFQKLLSVGHTEGVKCLECGHDEAKKLLSAPGVQFKGGGFYKTDSRPAAPAPSAPSTAPSAPPPTPPIESKPADAQK